MSFATSRTRWSRWASLHIGRLWFALELFPGEGVDLSFGVLIRGFWRIARVEV